MPHRCAAENECPENSKDRKLERFSRQEYWSGLPCPPQRDLPNPGTEPTSPALAGGFFITEPAVKPPVPVSLFLLFTCIHSYCRASRKSS